MGRFCQMKRKLPFPHFHMGHIAKEGETRLPAVTVKKGRDFSRPDMVIGGADFLQEKANIPVSVKKTVQRQHHPGQGRKGQEIGGLEPLPIHRPMDESIGLFLRKPRQPEKLGAAPLHAFLQDPGCVHKTSLFPFLFSHMQFFLERLPYARRAVCGMKPQQVKRVVFKKQNRLLCEIR